MNKLTLLAAAAALMTATPAAAQGYLGVVYQDGEEEAFGNDIDVEAWKGEGAFGWNGGSWGAQLNGNFGNFESEFGADSDFWSLDGHLYWQGGGWRLGGFLATWEIEDSDENTYGIEGMYDFNEQLNVYASYGEGESNVITDLDTSFFEVGGNFYFTPNVRVGANLGRGEIESSGGSSDLESYGIDAEFMPWSAPVSITLAYDDLSVDPEGFGSQIFQVGVRWNFGGGTLRERDNATPFRQVTHWGARLIGTY